MQNFSYKKYTWKCLLRNGGHFVQGKWAKASPVFLDSRGTCEFVFHILDYITSAYTLTAEQVINTWIPLRPVLLDKYCHNQKYTKSILLQLSRQDDCGCHGNQWTEPDSTIVIYVFVCRRCITKPFMVLQLNTTSAGPYWGTWVCGYPGYFFHSVAPFTNMI